MLDEFDQRVETLQAFMHIAVPQGPFGAIQQAPRVVVRIFRISVPNLDALGHVLEHREPHRDVKPIDHVLGPRMQFLGP